MSAYGVSDSGAACSEVTQIDESMISGEAEVVVKRQGDKVLAGTIVMKGTFRMRAEEVGAKTMLANMIRMVQEAQGSKARFSVLWTE